MPHPLVVQLRFTRAEFQRGLEGVTDAEARQRFLPMNCISWNIGHLAWQEQDYWLGFAQKKMLLPKLNEDFCYSCPAITPPLDESQATWRTIIETVDPFLDTLTNAELTQCLSYDNGEQSIYTPGSLMQRVIYHYWYHTGENQAIRQMLGHKSLPDFVGDLDENAPYVPH